MELLQFTGSIKNIGYMNESFILINKNNSNEYIIDIWDNILLKKLFNNKHGFKLNYIKLINFNSDIIIIVDDNNSLIIIDIHKCKLLLEIIVKKKILLNTNLRLLLSDKDRTENSYDLYVNLNTSEFTKNKKKLCYENLFTIKKLKKNENIVKIDTIDMFVTRLGMFNNHYNYKLIILTENNKLHSMEIVNNLNKKINNDIITLLSKNIYDYHLFKKEILIVKITKKKELYYRIKHEDINIDVINNIDLNREKKTINIKKQNIVSRIYNEHNNYYSIIDIDSNYISHTLLIRNYNSIASLFLRNLYAPKTMKMYLSKIILNGMLISYKNPFKQILNSTFTIKCIFNNGNKNDVTEYTNIKGIFYKTHKLIMKLTYYITKNDKYINFILLNNFIIVYDISNRTFQECLYDEKDINNQYITHYDQFKTNTIPTIHQPYITLNFVIKNKYLKHILMMLIYHINNKYNIYIPILCWDIIFNNIKEHDFPNNLLLIETRLKRQHSSTVFNSANKKQKLK